MHTKRMICVLVASMLLASASASAQTGKMAGDKMAADKMAGEMKGHGMMNAAQVDKMTNGWPKASREAIQFMQKKYGAPAAMTNDMVVWGKTGPWKRTVIFKAEVPHNFPGPHTDVMQQWVDYKAPQAMYDDLAMYDGSVVLERTAGEASARCDKEAANFLALNLTDEISRGKITVAAARMKYGEQIMMMKAGKPAPYTEKLMFTASGDTRDADQALPMKK